jgi:hypothetical protein
VLVIDGAHPRARDLHAPATESHRPVFMAVTLRPALRIGRAFDAQDH